MTDPYPRAGAVGGPPPGPGVWGMAPGPAPAPVPPPGPPGYPPPAGRRDRPISTGAGPGRLLTMVVVAAGVLNLICGFLPAYGHAYADTTIPVLTTAGAYAPILLLIGGLVAAGTILPGGGRHDFLTAVLSGAGAVGALATFLLGEPPLAIGAILLLIVGVLQALAAVGAVVAGRTAPAAPFHAAPAPPGAPVPVGQPFSPGRPPAMPQPAAPVPPFPPAPSGLPPVPPAPPAAATARTPAAPVAPRAPSASDASSALSGSEDGDDPEATRIVRF